MYMLAEPLQREADQIPLELYTNGELDLLALCKSLGIQVLNVHFKKAHGSGALIHEGDSWIIYVNDNDSSQRKRFTVAHELGHYFSYKIGLAAKKYIDDHHGHMQDFAMCEAMDGECRLLEMEANQFASRILMPENAVNKLYTEGKNVEEMAKYFGVSECAMTFRLMDLGYTLLEQISHDITR